MESVSMLNKRLADRYGNGDNGLPTWRIVWTTDQTEKRLGTFLDYSREGIFLREVREVREVPKYLNYAKDRWVLERLTPVEGESYQELQTKLSYEPMWIFENSKNEIQYPTWRAVDFLIKHVLERMFNPSYYAKYKEDEKTIPTQESWDEQVKELQQDLFGNETEVSDALGWGSGIVVPTNFEKTVN